MKTLEQTKAIEDLNKSRDKLEKMKEKAEKKLLSVKSELETTEHGAKESKERARNMLEVVTSEMKTLKKSLEKAEKRKAVCVIPDLLTLSRAAASGGKFYLQQRSIAGNNPNSQTVAPRPDGRPSPDLVDFREVVSQMLGLNMTSLALPDYRIIKCLERLIHSHQHHFVTCACLKDVTTRQDGHPQGHLQLLH
eukprot:bmy_14548T0